MSAQGWPREITLQCSTEGGNLSSVILVLVQLIATKKNNITLGSFLTDGQGRIVLTVKMLEAAIHSAMSDDPMDYASPLSDCIGLRITVEEPQELEARLHRVRRYYPRNAEELADKIRRSSNKGYVRYERDILLPYLGHSIPVELTAL